MVNPHLSSGLPAFSSPDRGLNSGYMMAQMTAAALVAESRTLAMPASIGSIPTDANQEDFVPMGMAAAYKTRRILVNARRVVAAELLCGAQALELLRPLTPGRGVGELLPAHPRGGHRPARRRPPAGAGPGAPGGGAGLGRLRPGRLERRLSLPCSRPAGSLSYRNPKPHRLFPSSPRRAE